MIGIQIALTGIVVFLFAVFIASLAKEPPRQDSLYGVCSIVALIGAISIPTGLIIAIWQ